ncbi:MAG: ABC transporter permease [Cyclobacteriaceae bacterium]
MIHQLFTAFREAIVNIRSHLLHTVLSTLGIIIGVASLVAILSLIDGMEQFARDQISSTTSLNALSLDPEFYRTNNGVRIRKDSTSAIGRTEFNELRATFPAHTRSTLIWQSSEEISKDSSKYGAELTAVDGHFLRTLDIAHGTFPDTASFMGGGAVCLVSETLATAMHLSLPLNGQTSIQVHGHTLKVAAIFREKQPSSRLIFPAALLAETDFRNHPPQVAVVASHVEQVPDLEKSIRAWLASQQHPVPGDYAVHSNEGRVAQAAQGFRLFRIIMGLIVGISVLVGGVGIMNVLVIAVTERTREIGLRKAVGAHRRDIVLQFLAESITVSVFGSLIGLFAGIAGTMITVPIIKAITKVPFQANYTLNTLVVIVVVAILTGIVFGTYPALKAARLDPVDAIRHE